MSKSFRNIRMRKPGSEGAPSAEDLKNSQVKEESQIYENKITHIVSKVSLPKHIRWMDSEGYDTTTKALPKEHPKHKTHVGIVSGNSVESGYHEDGMAVPIKEEVKGEYERKVDTYLKKKYKSQKKLPQGSDFAAARRKERLASNGRMDEAVQIKYHMGTDTYRGKLNGKSFKIPATSQSHEMNSKHISKHAPNMDDESAGHLAKKLRYYYSNVDHNPAQTYKEEVEQMEGQYEMMGGPADELTKNLKIKEQGVAEANGGPAGSTKVRYTSGMHGTYEPTKHQSSPQAHLDAAKYHDNEANTYITAMNSPKALPKDTEWYKGEIHHHKNKADFHRQSSAKQGVAEEVEQIDEGRPSQQHPIEGHEYHKKSDAELRYIMKDAGTAAKAMKDHSPRAESKYLDQVNDASTVLSFRQRNGTPAWYKKKYDHVNESVDTPPFTPDAPKKNSGVVVGKRPEGMSKARHLARLAMKGELNKKKTVKEDSSNDVEKTNTPAKRTVSKTTMIVKDAAKSSKDKKNKDKFEPEPELSSQIVRNNF